MPRVVSLKINELRKRGYNNVHEWLADAKHLYIGRKRPKFTNIRTNEPPNTYVALDDSGQKKLIRPYKINTEWDQTLLSHPVGSYVSKYRQIVEIEIAESKWHNPFKVNHQQQRHSSVSHFKQYLLSNAQLMSSLSELQHYTELGCWCKPASCHGDIILAEYHKWKFRQKKMQKEIQLNDDQKRESPTTNPPRLVTQNTAVASQKGRTNYHQIARNYTPSTSYNNQQDKYRRSRYQKRSIQNTHNTHNNTNIDVWNMDDASANMQSQKKKIRLICISDTHNNHSKLTDELNKLYESENDVLIHCGDMTESGKKWELNAVNEWLKTLKFKHKFIISGNMDGFGLDSARNRKYMDGHQIFASSNTIYLEHELYTVPELNGLSVFGTPYTPKFVGGFQLKNGNESVKMFASIPQCDVLISHGPPHSILDKTSKGETVGDRYLLRKVVHEVKPNVMVFGHIHESYGVLRKYNITFINAAQYNGVHMNRKDIKPVVHVLYK